MMGACASYQVPEDLVNVTGDLDSDRDDLPDRQEISLGTDPKSPDTDMDGLKDGIEVKMRLDPMNIDTDEDDVPDADDFLPKINNNILYLSVGISFLAITIAILSWIHIKYGFSKSRKDVVRNKRKRQKEEELLFQQVRDNILDLARQNHGWLMASEVAKELTIEPELVVKYFTMLKAKKEKQLYRFPQIEKIFNKR